MKPSFVPRESELLARAIDLVKAAWSTGHTARDAGERPVSPASPQARSFSALGALRRAAREHRAPPWVEGRAIAAVAAHIPPRGPWQRISRRARLRAFNDDQDTSKLMLLTALRRARDGQPPGPLPPPT